MFSSKLILGSFIILAGCTASIKFDSITSEDETARRAIIENDKSLKKAFAEIYYLKQQLADKEGKK